MASTYSNLKIELITTGEQAGTWGATTNTNLGTALEEAITGTVDVSFSSADVTLTLTDTNATQTARNLRLNLTGTSGGARNLIVPAIEKLYIVNNGLADAVTVKNASGTGIAVPAGKTMLVFNNATNVLDVTTYLTSLTLGSALPVASGGSGAATLTGVLKGNGTSAFTAATAGTDYVAPGGALGTPASATLTNATGLPISTGVSGLGSNVATFLGTPSSANLAAALTDETGSGSAVFATSPTVNNPTITNYVESVVAIGTVTSSNTIALTNGTVQTATLTASTACTFTMPTATAGKSFILLLKQAASTGNGTATFTGVKWGTAGAPTISATADKMDILSFVSDGTNWYGSVAAGFTP